MFSKDDANLLKARFIGVFKQSGSFIWRTLLIFFQLGEIAAWWLPAGGESLFAFFGETESVSLMFKPV